MKNQKLDRVIHYPNPVLKGMCALLFLFLVGLLQAQPYYTTPLADGLAQPADGNQANIRNTGTDALAYPVSDEHHCNTDYHYFQVMVFDGPDGQFSWDVRTCPEAGNHHGNLNLMQEGYAERCDPDVVIGRIGDQIWATVVGISDTGFPGYGRVLVRNYRWIWGDAEFVQLDCNQLRGNFLGITWANQLTDPMVSGQSQGRICQSPNIDANTAGEVVIVWNEVENVYTEVVWSDPFNGYKQNYFFKRGNVYSAQGYVDGSGPFHGCIGGRCDTANSFRPNLDDTEANSNVNPWLLRQWVIFTYDDLSPGDAIGLPEAGNAEDSKLTWFSWPDVCISERSLAPRSIITYVFYKAGFNPFGFTNGPTGMVVTQYVYDRCYFENATDNERENFFVYEENHGTGDYWRKSDYTGMLGGPPRIAARDTVRTDSVLIRDFTLVMANAGGYCDAEIGDTIISPVRVWGRREDLWNTNGVTINSYPTNPATVETQYINTEAVVAHWCNFTGNNQDFVVAWTALGVQPDGDRNDILAKTYRLDFTAIDDVTLEPYGDDYSYVNHQRTGYHYAPSIAGRHLADMMAYDWSSSSDRMDKFKKSCTRPGDEGSLMNCFPVTPDPRPGNPGKTTYLKIEPNPSTGSFVISTKDRNGQETLESVQITDITGRVVYRKTSFEKGTRTIQWKPDAGLPPGLFQARVKTSHGLFNGKLIRK